MALVSHSSSPPRKFKAKIYLFRREEYRPTHHLTLSKSVICLFHVKDFSFYLRMFMFMRILFDAKNKGIDVSFYPHHQIQLLLIR